MDRRRLMRAAVCVAATLLLILDLGSTSNAATRDRTPPTAPRNLRMTALTPYSVTLTWTAATDRSGIAAYLLCCAGNNSERVPGDVLTHTFRSGLEPNRSFRIYVIALDNAGNTSQNSPSVSFTTPRDTTPPTKPTLQVVDVGDTWASLAWSSVDDGPNVWFTVSRDGSAVLTGSRATSGSFAQLQPETTYTFAVEARDFAGQSVISDPVVITTKARDTSDVTPPTAPGSLNASFWANDGETWLNWAKSTDDRSPQALIVYRVYVNGVLDHTLLDYNQTVVYGKPQSRNTYTVTAVDSNGNESAPATIEVDNF